MGHSRLSCAVPACVRAGGCRRAPGSVVHRRQATKNCSVIQASATHTSSHSSGVPTSGAHVSQCRDSARERYTDTALSHLSLTPEPRREGNSSTRKCVGSQSVSVASAERQNSEAHRRTDCDSREMMTIDEMCSSSKSTGVTPAPRRGKEGVHAGKPTLARQSPPSAVRQHPTQQAARLSQASSAFGSTPSSSAGGGRPCSRDATVGHGVSQHKHPRRRTKRIQRAGTRAGLGFRSQLAGVASASPASRGS